MRKFVYVFFVLSLFFVPFSFANGWFDPWITECPWGRNAPMDVKKAIGKEQSTFICKELPIKEKTNEK